MHILRTLRTLGGSNRSRCGAVRILSRSNRSRCDAVRILSMPNRSRCGAVHMLSAQSEPSAHFGWVESLSVSFRSVDQKCRSEVSVGSVDRSVVRKCRSEVLLRSVDQKCRTEVLLRSVAQTCPSEMLSEVWIRSVALYCPYFSCFQIKKNRDSPALWRSVCSKCCTAPMFFVSKANK